MEEGDGEERDLVVSGAGALLYLRGIAGGVGEPALAGPGPVGDGGVDPARDHDAVEEVRPELAPLGDRPRHYGGRSRREHKLREKSGMCTVGTWAYLEEPLWVEFKVHLEVEVLRASAEVVAIRTIGQAPPDGPVGRRSNKRIQHVLDQDVHSVL